MNTQSLDLFSQQFHQNPYDYYQNIRPHQPFAKVNMFIEGQRTWMAFTYEAAEAVLKDDRFIKDMRTVFPDEVTNENLPPIAQSMLFVDPPDHRRLRSLVQSGFTPKRIAKLSGRIEEIAREQASLMRNKKTVDFIEDYAFPIPIRVICELLGIPSEDRLDFQRWSNVMVEISDNAHYDESMSEFMTYLEKLIKEKRLSPKEDLLSDLIQVEEGGDRLQSSELYGVVMLLIVAGHETTVNLIANGLLALLTHPDQLELLKADHSLMAQAIEELLRFNGPVEFSTDRWARESFTFMGQQVEKGDHVLVSLASADHDPAAFADPSTLDITRKKSPHLAFGKGLHYCLGAPLARLEGEIALRVLLEEYPNLTLAAELSELEWRQSLIIRGLKRLPIKLV
ncbi:cytochrome P450 [Alkalihalobacillus alcalophilus ATCC 27647 = CGMCC 1.3604]|uniref:Cytochrome P450 n=1 Tax=Alkalihalobacillus alcalophilus ATCC 27647 = CGMCC 1.3604 TaxID=1218173 RepID=A0A094XBG6_ALKAL|nr:cytochrome P450 [Alkalihalobacillus alcalophilus]KGA96150.1 cytochrome P450 [Alkalihalobacillus alcalophilus ATCC 27647 = CGMCC 1.3604]MED1563182.1 cytochrome P450 [Alkalihalobacillus alcalophilus]THG89282.1 cytochrome P450 [Alkalihalobacillus alcalophilus ATCC 27647 = CGMCC 1.3604]